MLPKGKFIDGELILCELKHSHSSDKVQIYEFE